MMMMSGMIGVNAPTVIIRGSMGLTALDVKRPDSFMNPWAYAVCGKLEFGRQLETCKSESQKMYNT
jgi:hypothetical protein